MRDSEVIAESSPAPSAAPVEVSVQDVMAKATHEQRQEWKRTGKIPEVTASTATSEPAKAGETAPESEPGKTVVQAPKKELTPEERSARDRKHNEQRFKRLEREAAEARQRADAAERQLRERPKAESSPAAAKADGEPVMPDLETFEGTVAEFNAAMKKYNADLVKHEIAKHESAAQAAKHQQDLQDNNGKFQKGMLKFMETHDDFQYSFDVVMELDRTAPHLSETIVELGPELGPRVIYHLGQNEAEVERLAGLPKGLAGVELGKFIANLPAPALEPKVKKETSAPNPGRSVGGTHSAVADPLEAAYKAGDMVTAMRLENERAIAKATKK